MLFAVNSYDENSVVGCGYVSDHYLETLPNHQNLELLGVTDLKPERAQVLATHYGLNIYNCWRPSWPIRRSSSSST